MVESSKMLKPWRESIRWEVLRHGVRAPIEGAVCVMLEFIMPRPASAPKRRTPPATKRPDVDKLARAALDALCSAGVYRDDAQVTELVARKRIREISESPGVRIRVAGAPTA